MTWNQTRAKFRAVEAECITGISREMQRSLRKRGFLPQQEGWAAFELGDLTYLFVLGRLAAAGVGPKVADQIAKTAGLVLESKVLRLEGAVDDPDNRRGTEQVVHLPPDNPLAPHRNFPKQRFLVAFPNDVVAYQDEIAAAFDQHQAASAFVLDLDRSAHQMVERADRPFVTISLAARD